MELLRSTYHFLLDSLEPLARRFLSSKLLEDPLYWQGRLGYYAHEPAPLDPPRVWFHAASVGEVTGAIPIIRILRQRLPGAGITLTVTTPQGFQFACTNLSQWAQILPFPLDFPAVLERAFGHLQPDLYVGLEGEFWPNFFRVLERRQTPAVLLNGHLAHRSARLYGLLGSLFRPIFKQFVWLAMHTEEDRRNVLALGASSERTCVLGSSKYDALMLRKDPEKVLEWRRVLELPDAAPVMVGGSLRRMECINLLEIFHKLTTVDSRLIGIFAPRHMTQIPNMVRWLKEHQIAFQLLSRIETARAGRSSAVILVDRIGILFDLYALGDLTFCGGTLEPFGGHNIMEPAAWGKAVFYGPHLQKVSDEHNILQSLEGSFRVQNASDLLQQWSYWIQHLSDLRGYGENAEAALSKVGGVAVRQVELIMRALCK